MTVAQKEEGSVAAYTAAFVGSLLATLAAYALVRGVRIPGALTLVVALAVVQIALQVLVFLRFERQPPRWRLVSFGATAVIVTIIVGGSLWIMQSLNGRMMPSMDVMMQYLQSQDAM